MAAALALGGGACGGSDAPVVEVVMPGSIALTTVTSGFIKDDSYELLLDGVSQGTIGANDEITLADLDPATYELTLGDVADNCSVESTSVPVAAEDTAQVSLTVSCSYGEPDAYVRRFNRERPLLDTGTIAECPFGLCPSGAEWDLYVYYSSASDPHSVIRQNQATGIEIAHLPGVTLEDLTEDDVQGAVFTADLVPDPFDAGRVILVRTESGTVYALGNPVEDTSAQTLTFDAVRVAGPTS